MSYYTTIRCKCIVKQEYRQLIADIITKIPTQIAEINNDYIRQLLMNGSRFGCFFQDNMNGWHEAIAEDPVAYLFDVESGEWHFHVSINKESDEIEEFLVRFNPRFLESIYFLEIYDENSVTHFLEERWNNYLITSSFVDDLIDEFGKYWANNIHLESSL